MVKNALVGAALGRAFVSTRSVLRLALSLRQQGETAGFTANDHLARFLVSRTCRPGGIFVDVGAHLGAILDAVRQQDGSVRIVAIEADPEKAARLASSFPDIVVHPCAVGERSAELSFFLDLRRPGFSSLERHFVDDDERHVKEIRVPVKRLDELLSDVPNVDMIKLIVEGSEYRVLQGSDRLVERCRPVLMFESAPATALDETREVKTPLWSWLSDRSYEIHVPNRVAHEAPPLSCEGFVESHLYPRRTTHYFAIPRERRSEYRERARRALGYE